MGKWILLAAMAATVGCASTGARRDETGGALREETEQHRIVTGRVAAVDKYRNIVLVDEAGGRRMQLRLSRETVVSAEGRPAAVGDIKEGVPIRAAYRPRLGQNVALVVDVTRAGSFPPGNREGNGANNARAPGGQPGPHESGVPATAP